MFAEYLMSISQYKVSYLSNIFLGNENSNTYDKILFLFKL